MGFVHTTVNTNKKRKYMHTYTTNRRKQPNLLSVCNAYELQENSNTDGVNGAHKISLLTEFYK